MREVNILYIHHSASPLTTTTAAIGRWHAARFRLGIGYHRVIEADGAVLDGRKVQRVGAAVRGHNKKSINVCVVGDNTVGGRHWTAAQNAALEKTIRYYHALYPSIKIGGHRDAPGASTLCPGLSITKWCKHRNIKARFVKED